ncbi:MAG: putative quinol monooxygenase [Lawsonibacter sp.]|jgi:quinol monooxygenase YgiN
MLGINVIYTMKPGMAKEFVDEVTASGALQAVRKEEGCLRYDYYFSAENPDQVLLLEQWESREAQKVHMTQPHMEQIAAAKARCALDAKLEFYDL